MFARRLLAPLAAARCFSTTPVLRAVSPYLLFMKKHGNDSRLKKLAVPERGRMLAKWYHALDAAELAKLKAKAANTATPKRHTRKAKFLTRWTQTQAAKKLAPKDRTRAAARAWAKRNH